MKIDVKTANNFGNRKYDKDGKSHPSTNAASTTARDNRPGKQDGQAGDGSNATGSGERLSKKKRMMRSGGGGSGGGPRRNNEVGRGGVKRGVSGRGRGWFRGSNRESEEGVENKENQEFNNNFDKNKGDHSHIFPCFSPSFDAVTFTTSQCIPVLFISHGLLI